MNALRLLIALFCLATLVACNDSKSKSLEKIEKLEKQLLDANGNPKDEVSAYNLQVEYDDFASRFPDDPQAPEFLYKTATISINLNWGESAVKVLEKFLTMFPNDKRAPEALFFLGFVYDNQINDDSKAGTYYNDFLKKYPNHVLAKDVEASIRNLGKTDEELIREFERMNSDSSRKDSAS
jgi:outer membrane protein assembly factor BamD (BamD/ComL family)